MEKLNFLPLWEMERRDKIKRNNSYLFLFVLILGNLLLFIFLLYNKNNLHKLKIENTYKVELNNKKPKDVKTQVGKKIESLKSYQWYKKEISKDIILKEMIIKNKEIILSAKAKDYNEYISIVSYIENKCKVKDVSIAKFNENYLEFTLTLEANYE